PRQGRRSSRAREARTDLGRGDPRAVRGRRSDESRAASRASRALRIVCRRRRADHPLTSHVIARSVLARASSPHADAVSPRRHSMSTVQLAPTTRTAVDAFVAGWNAHSPKAVRAAFTDDGRVTDPVVGRWLSGAEIEAAAQ